MHHPRLFMFLTFLMLAGTAGTIASYVIWEKDGTFGPPGEVRTRRPVIQSKTPRDGSALPVDSSVGESGPDPLVTGIRLTVPEWSEMPTIKTIPWTRSEATAAFRDAETRSCRLLEAGMDVAPALVAVRSERRPLGRAPAFTIGLEVDAAARNQLPDLSKGAIESYLNDHRIVIEAPIYTNEEGLPFLGTEIKAACFKIDSPSRSISPEPMVASAVGELRVVGTYRPDDTASTAPPSTLVLLFRYTREDKTLVTGIAGSPVKEFELLFLHLLNPKAGETPKLLAFSTSKGRQTFHELRELPMNGNTAGVTAQIRFAEFTTLGLYPSSPVVVDVAFASRSALPVEILRGRLTGTDSQPGVTLSQLLDELHTTPSAVDDP